MVGYQKLRNGLFGIESNHRSIMWRGGGFTIGFYKIIIQIILFVIVCYFRTRRFYRRNIYPNSEKLTRITQTSEWLQTILAFPLWPLTGADVM